MPHINFVTALIVMGIVLIIPFIFTSFGEFPMLNVFFIITVFVSIFWFLLSSCSKKPKINEDDYKAKATELYEKGLNDVYHGSCSTAFDNFEKASEIYPYSEIAKRSLVMEIYCNYNLKNYEQAVSLSEIYYKFYPYEADIGYVMFIRAMSLKNTIFSTKRDPSVLHLTRDNIVYHLQNFKNSKYANLLQQDFLKIEQMIYTSELDVATYYLNTNNIIAAAKRLAFIENNFAKYSFYNQTKVLQMKNAIHKKLM